MRYLNLNCAANGRASLRFNYRKPFQHAQYHVQQLRSFLEFMNPRKHYRENKIVNFTPQQVFEVVSDVANYKKFVPFCVNSQIIRHINAETLDAELTVGFKIFTESYTSRVILKNPTLVAARAVNSKIFNELSTTWKFKQGPREGSTLLSFEVEFEVKNRIAATAVNAFFEDVTQQQVSAFERRCRQLYNSQSCNLNNNSSTQSLPYGPKTAGGHDLKAFVGLKFPVCNEKAVETDISIIRKIVFERIKIQKLSAFDINAFLDACHQLSLANEMQGFMLLAGDTPLAQAVHSSLSYMVKQRRTEMNDAMKKRGKPPRSDAELDYLALEDFIVSLYMVVQASPNDRSRYMFYAIDMDEDHAISREELRRALELHMMGIAKVIPELLKYYLLRGGLNSGPTELQFVHQPDVDAVLSKSDTVIRKLLGEIMSDIPSAVDQVFEHVEADIHGSILEAGWECAWHNNPELLDMMSLKGMSKIVLFATELVTSSNASIDSSAN